MAAKDKLGKDGEQLAVEYLQAGGMQVLDRNWRCREGEIDVVARDGGTLVIVEVKTRSGHSHGSALEAVDRGKLARLRALAGRWLSEWQGERFDSVRIDVIGLEKVGRTFAIRHERGVI
ncbi:putative endonuclease [Thermocatellispora tengchongensis]|uniref:UPF0102 protein HNP84_008025 n=1 Tax=Thermocatellispora tengchongensis TaxID=1073253 RepID=A0A840PGJ9_9ACTN|nr:YraN family protein [Thermocatellispora tengchongensis]MBB5138272.1 putative endonuclease [Thermocatellispora tengchongensis]